MNMDELVKKYFPRTNRCGSCTYYTKNNINKPKEMFRFGWCEKYNKITHPNRVMPKCWNEK